MLKRTIYAVVARLFSTVALLAVMPTLASAKSASIIYRADRLENAVVNQKSCKKLEGNVVFTLKDRGIILTADRAYRYTDQELIEAAGNVKMVDQDSRVIQADLLSYYPEQKLTVWEDHVACTVDNATLQTSRLIYNIHTQQGEFTKTGKLLKDQMVLTSCTGTYDGVHHKVTFAQEVLLEEPSYSLRCHKLCYDTEAEMVSFQGFTEITLKDGVLTTPEGGSYLPYAKRLIIQKGNWTTPDGVLAADHLEVLDMKDGVAKGHVSIQSKAGDMVVVGEQATYSEQEQKVEITGHPLLTKVINDEKIYLRADSFMAIKRESGGEQEIHALHHVRLYQDSLQGVADGAVYRVQDHTIHLHNKPIIWCAGYQITGEEVYLAIEEKEERIKMFVNESLFMVSEDTAGNYNQVQGHKMVASFKEGAVEAMSIEGNGESLYFILGAENELIGMNHIKCENMEITVQDNVLERMVCKPHPIGTFYPAELLEVEQMKLANFAWYGEQWPTKENMLIWPVMQESR